MTHILTFIADTDACTLETPIIERALADVPDTGDLVWLSPDEACDVLFAPENEKQASQAFAAAKKALGNLPVDVICQPQVSRRKKLLVADMDSTLIGQECIDELADFAGLKAKISGITERAMRGELEFEPALRERVGLLKGLDESVLETVFRERITLNPGARTVARTMEVYGAKTIIVSGGFTFFTERVARAAGFSANHANMLQIADAKLSGQVIEPILGQQAKLERLCQYREELGLKREETLAVGDGANDLAMINEAGLGVAYRAKPVVAEQADAHLQHTSLTSLLFAQGYERDAFVMD